MALEPAKVVLDPDAETAAAVLGVALGMGLLWVAEQARETVGKRPPVPVVVTPDPNARCIYCGNVMPKNVLAAHVARKHSSEAHDI